MKEDERRTVKRRLRDITVQLRQMSREVMDINDDHLIRILDSIVEVGELVEDLSVDVDFASSVRFGNAEVLVQDLPDSVEASHRKEKEERVG